MEADTLSLGQYMHDNDDTKGRTAGGGVKVRRSGGKDGKV